MKLKTQWYSQELGQQVEIVRWGVIGTPVIVFPTAGGDAEEIERFLMIDALAPLLEAGRVKIYSCDSVAGRAMVTSEGSPSHRLRLMNAFQRFIRTELVAAIRTDCHDDDIEVLTAGSSIGAFYALAAVCRYPDVFSHAICLSGTYNLQRFLDSPPNDDLYFSSPLHFLPGLEGATLERLKSRFVLLASGEGHAEDISESWKVADVLGSKAIPNRVDSWGPDWPHDWTTWRKMLPQYLDELLS